MLVTGTSYQVLRLTAPKRRDVRAPARRPVVVRHAGLGPGVVVHERDAAAARALAAVDAVDVEAQPRRLDRRGEPGDVEAHEDLTDRGAVDGDAVDQAVVGGRGVVLHVGVCDGRQRARDHRRVRVVDRPCDEHTERQCHHDEDRDEPNRPPALHVSSSPLRHDVPLRPGRAPEAPSHQRDEPTPQTALSLALSVPKGQCVEHE